VLKQIIPARIKGLKKGFGTTNIQLVEVEPRTQAEQNALLSMDMDVQIPGEQFRQDIQRIPDAKAVISMLGAPSGPKSPQAPLPARFSEPGGGPGFAPQRCYSGCGVLPGRGRLEHRATARHVTGGHLRSAL